MRGIRAGCARANLRVARLHLRSKSGPQQAATNEGLFAQFFGDMANMIVLFMIVLLIGLMTISNQTDTLTSD